MGWLISTENVLLMGVWPMEQKLLLLEMKILYLMLVFIGIWKAISIVVFNVFERGIERQKKWEDFTTFFFVLLLSMNNCDIHE